MYRHLLVLTAAGSVQSSCMLFVQAYVVEGDSTLIRRGTVTDEIHESFFIPAVVASGVVFLLGIVCVLMILFTSSAPNRSSIPHTRQIDHDQPTRPMNDNQPTSPRPRSAYLSRGNTASNTSASGSFYYNEPPSNKIQRKPAPVFQPSPNRSPPGTAGSQRNPHLGPTRGPGIGPSPPPSVPDSSFVHPLRQGVPQHPGLAKYNPEPLIYEPKPADVGETSSSPQKVMAYQWTRPQAQAQPQPQPGPPMSMLASIPASPSSLTRVGSGSGASDQQAQQLPLAAEHHSKANVHPVAPSAQNPPSPPPTPPLHSQTHQKMDQRQSHLPTATARPDVGSYGSSMDHRDAYGGIETDEEGVRAHHHHQHHTSSSSRPSQPPGYAESGPYRNQSQREYPPEKMAVRNS